MEKSVSKLLTSKIVSDAAKLFQATSNSNRLISDMANFVYECVRYDGPFILRLTHSSHRNLQEIKGELDWMSYLSKNDVTVPQSILSRQGTLVEVIDLEHSCFFVTAFRKIDGEGIIDGNACTPEVYKEWGRILGKMHCLAKSYVPEDASWRRSVWYENDIVANKGHYLAGQEKILEKFNGLLSNLAKLPQGKDDFALVHTDFTDVNFFIHDREITVFDFDDSEYHWFAYDVAVILFDTLPWLPHLGMNIDKFGEFFWGHFYSGYIEENNLNEYWLNQLPMFMKLREIFLYGVFHKKWDMESLTKD
ncbi:MAG: phosphotransferase [Chloroflexi bacterium]|nr:phosphotransferase [Chloroflexota bacterium]